MSDYYLFETPSCECFAFSDAVEEFDPNVLVIVGPPGENGEISPSSFAPVYDSAATWSVGDYCWQSGQLYTCIYPITTAEAWNANHWRAVKLAQELVKVKQELGDITGNPEIYYTVYGGYYTTNGTTVNTSAPTANANFNASIINCSPGDIFTINGCGGNSPRLWAFADASNNILSKSSYTARVEHVVLTAPANASKLIINNDVRYAPDAVSFYGKKVDERLDVIEDFDENGVGVTRTYNISLGSSSSVGQFWNTYTDWGVAAGDAICFEFHSYTGTKLSSCILRGLRSDGTYLNLAVDVPIGARIAVVSPESFPQLWVQLARSETENSVSASFYLASSSKGGIVGHVLETEKHVYRVEKNRSGDFTRLTTAIEYAEQFMDSVVYVGPGEWDILAELGSDYIQSVGPTKRGIVLKNRIHLIFSSLATVSCLYNGVNGVIKDDTVLWLSVFNAGEHGFTLENCRINSRNVRYAIHDEMGLTNSTPYTNKYINCQITHSNQKYDLSQGSMGYAQCIGGGLGTDGRVVISGCVFENPYQYSADAQGRKVLVSYHTQGSSADSRSSIEIVGCYFRGPGTCRGAYYGSNAKVTTMLVHDNSFGKAPFVSAETASDTTVNIEMLEWNNEVRPS